MPVKPAEAVLNAGVDGVAVVLGVVKPEPFAVRVGFDLRDHATLVVDLHLERNAAAVLLEGGAVGGVVELAATPAWRPVPNQSYDALAALLEP